MNSETPPSPDEFVEGTVLEDQMDKCDELIEDIVMDRMDPTDVEDPYNKVNFHYGRAKDKSKKLLSNRFESIDLNNALKLVVRGIIEERGFDSKLARSGQKDDDLKTTVRWFKLYSAIILNKQPEIKYENDLIRFKEYRDNTTEHRYEGVPAATYRPEGSLLGFLTLSWIALEHILRLWGDILSLSPNDIEDKYDDLNTTSPKYGFIHYRGYNHGYVTTFPEGQNGDSTKFEKHAPDYFPDEGDIVKLYDSRDGNQYKAISMEKFGN
ncbi:hypothetical protein ACLI4Y_12960 [Natrialbaceae archaeon A-CW3]